MKYISLYKKFFISPNSEKTDYEILFNSPSTLKFNILNNNYPYFVNVNNEILRLIEKIYSINNDIVQLTYANRDLPNTCLSWIVNHTLVEEIRMSNEIEGVASTRKEITDLILKKEPKHYKRLYGMVSKYLQLINKDEELFIQKSEDIRQLYNKTILRDIEKDNEHNIPDGEIFRKESVDVTASERVIYTGLYPESTIITTMNEALNILNNDEISLLIRVAVFHYFFGYIHPFYDGNGRMSRFISSIYLSKELDVLCSLQLSVSCKHHQKTYYDSFKITNDIRNKGDLTHFVITFLEIIYYGLQDLKQSIEDKTTQYFYYESLIDKIDLPDKYCYLLLLILLQNNLFGIRNFTLNDLVENSLISKQTIQKKLSDPILQHYIIVDKSNKAYTYSLNLDAISTTK